MRLKHPLIITLSYIFAIVIAILAVLWLLTGTITGYFHPRTATFFPSHNQLLLATFLASGCFLLIWALSRFFARHYGGWFLLFGVLISIPKVILAIQFPIHPISDMYSYKTLAASRALGDSWQWLNHAGVLDLDSIWPHVLHIATLDELIFKLTITSPFMIELFNIICVIFCALLIVSLAQRFFSRTVGFFSATVFLLMPNWYLYSFLIGAEPSWLLFQLLGLYFVTRIVTNNWRWSSLRFWGMLILAVICLFAANEIQPLTIIVAIAVAILGLFKVPTGPDSTDPSAASRATIRRYFWMPRISVLLILGVFLGLNQASTAIDHLFYNVPIANSSIGVNYTLAVGTNPQTHGMYSLPLIKQLERANHNHQLTNHQKFSRFNHILAHKLAINRHDLVTHHQTSQLITTKNQELMNPDYGIVLLYLNTIKKPGNSYLTPSKLITPFTTISTAVQLNLLFLALVGLMIQLVPKKTSQLQWRRQNGTLLFASMMIGFTLIFMVVEVQSRYQIGFYIPWVMLAGVGMNELALLNERLIR